MASPNRPARLNRTLLLLTALLLAAAAFALLTGFGVLTLLAADQALDLERLPTELLIRLDDARSARLP